MPRSVSDGVGGTLFRTVFAKSPLSLVSTSEEEKSSSTRLDGAKLRRRRSPSFLHHKRSNSQQLEAPNEEDGKPSSFKEKRQRSFSHVERIRPLSLSKLALHTSADTPAPSSASSLENANEAHHFEDEKFYGRVLNHGDAQTTHTGWRKKHEYLVVTEHYLLRFKSAKKAADKFPWLFPISSQIRHPRSTKSISSFHEMSSPTGSESPTDFLGTKSIIPLQHVIAVQAVQDSRTRVTLEVI